MKVSKHLQTWALAMLLPICGALTANASPQFQNVSQDQEPETVLPQDAELPVQEPAVNDTPGINKKLVGWQEAGLGTNGERVGTKIRANWVMLDNTDGINGQIFGASEMSIFLLRDGFVVSRTTTSPTGEFRLESGSPGIYTIVGYAADGFFSYGFNAIEHTEANASGVPRSIETLAVSGRENTKLIAKLIVDNSASVNFRTYGKYDVDQGANDPAEYYGFEGLKTLDVPTIPATTIKPHRVAILQDGRLIGRVHQTDNRTGRPVEIRSTNIVIIQDGQIMAETQVDSMGVFEVAGLSAGTYGLVAVGADGFASFGFELVGTAMGSTIPAQTLNQNESPFRQVSHNFIRQDEPGVVDFSLSDPESVGWINAYVQEQVYVEAMIEPRPEIVDPGAGMANMPFDYFSYGQGGGGGGGGFGGGDWAGWIVPLGIAAIVIDAETNNGFGITSGGINLASPFFP